MIGRSIWVSCDGDDAGALCDEEFALMGTEATVAKVRAAARRAGWYCSAKSDLCPAHRSVVSR
jgi:hypothetical protein